jgi:hypothetical protein
MADAASFEALPTAVLLKAAEVAEVLESLAAAVMVAEVDLVLLLVVVW